LRRLASYHSQAPAVALDEGDVLVSRDHWMSNMRLDRPAS
jgi:hypothetical protein